MQRRTRLLLPFVLVTACATDDVHPRGDGDPTNVSEAGPDGAASHGQGVGDAGVDPGPIADAADAGLSPTDAGSAVAPPASGISCADLVCDVFATCVGADEPTCTCAPGLEGDGQRCTDVDECQLNADVCGEFASCQNSFGGYSCHCNPGYRLEGDVCVADDACVESPCAENATCSDVGGKLTCTCDASTFGNGFYCTAQDPCGDAPCGENAECIAVDSALRSFVCACPLGSAGESACNPCGTELTLQDPELELAVRQQLGLEDAQPILLQDLASHTSLDASEFDVTDLTGLECWSTLQVLDLSYNARLTADGAGALSSLNQLTELHLDCTQVTDLSLLEGHPHLKSLSANVLNCDEATLLDGVSQLATLPQLEELDVRGQQLADVSVLSELRNLRTLWFGHNQVDSLQELPDMPLLLELDLSFNLLSDVEGIERWPRLQYLNVSNNQLVHVAATEMLLALRVLQASNNQLAQLPDFSAVAELVQLDVSYNELTSVEPLAHLERAAWVSIASNEIVSLEPLIEGSLRGTLVVAGNPLPCGDQSDVFTELRGLGLDVLGDCLP